MMKSFKKKWLNRRWAIEKCSHRELPENICSYVNLFKKKFDGREGIENICFVVLDTETTGLNPAVDSILSIGAVKVFGRDIAVDKTFEKLIHHDKPAEKMTIAVHGILPSESMEGEEEERVLEQFLAYIGDSVLVAHHANFDISIINRALKRLYGIKIYNKHIDTLDLAMRIEHFTRAHEISGAVKYNLDSLCERYCIPTEERHTAVGDAYITAQLFLKLSMKARSRNINTIGRLLR